MRFYNTINKRKEEFKPINKDKITKNNKFWKEKVRQAGALNG